MVKSLISRQQTADRRIVLLVLPVKCRSMLWPIALLAICGCRGADSPDPATTRLGGVAQLMSNFLIAHRGQGPRDKQELLKYAESYDGLPQLLQQAGVSDVGALFVSERNERPFTVLFGPDLNAGHGIVGYEDEPVDGIRWVAFRSGFARQIPEADFQQMLAGE